MILSHTPTKLLIFSLLVFTVSMSTNLQLLTPNNLVSIQVSAQSSAEVNTEKFTGELIKKKDNILTLQSNNTTKDFMVPNGIKINRNTVAASLNNLETKDQITVTTNSNTGELISVESVSGQAIDNAKYIIPTTVLLLVTAGIAYYTWNSSQKGRIKTMSATRV